MRRRITLISDRDKGSSFIIASLIKRASRFAKLDISYDEIPTAYTRPLEFLTRDIFSINLCIRFMFIFIYSFRMKINKYGFKKTFS